MIDTARRSWSKTDTMELTAMDRGGFTTKRMAEILDRTEGAIEAKLYDLRAGKKPEKTDYATLSISIPRALIARVTADARKAGKTRSRYIAEQLRKHHDDTRSSND